MFRENITRVKNYLQIEKSRIMKDVTIAITAASYSGNKGAAAMLQSSIKQLYKKYENGLVIKLMSVYPKEDRKQKSFDFIEVVECKPEQLLFIAFPLSVLYFLLKWCLPIRLLIEKNKIIKAYTQTDVVIDEAGISFVDSRGFIMNTYALVSVLVPMLVGVPVVKYSQALGEFKSVFNCIYARLILPKVKLICARGEITKSNLKSINIEKNVKVCADGAFSMTDDTNIKDEMNKFCNQDSFYNNNVIAVSISSVVEKKCKELKINYKGIMVDFINYLTNKGYNVLIIANAARLGSSKPRNNDLMICDAVFAEISEPEKVRWYHEEMTAEKIRELIGHSRFLIASRFHSMIGGLYKEVPVLLIGWSHKYKEVLDMFNLGSFAADFSGLNLDMLIEKFDEFVICEQENREKIKFYLPQVIESSKNNIKYISEYIDKYILNKKVRGLFDFNNSEKYLGANIECRKGYAASEEIRENSASGGMVSALLCSLIRNGEIDGAWVTKSVIKDGQLEYKTGIAKTEQEILDCGTSIYMYMPLLKHIHEIEKFDGNMAVVLLPCQMRGFNKILENNSELKKKVKLRICLFCSGSHNENATLLPLKNAGISLENAKKLYYRKGHWRGITRIFYNDGTEKRISYTKTICAYKNAYFFVNESCMLCQDQYGYESDLSFGDIWLKEMKENPIKHTSCIVRTEDGKRFYDIAVKNGDIQETYISHRKMIVSQKRALVFKWNCAKAKEDLYHKINKKIKLNTESRCKWNHRFAFWLAYKNRKLSMEKLDMLERVPGFVIYFYMAFIRVLLSF
ncbi:MAG TPA: hypothetical protein DIC60_00015 [Lachnospiraceae bacterium]|nr:hypothetical protein [Lachnospiraceae bacterium]